MAISTISSHLKKYKAIHVNIQIGNTGKKSKNIDTGV